MLEREPDMTSLSFAYLLMRSWAYGTALAIIFT